MAKVFYEILGHWEGQGFEQFTVSTREEAEQIACGLRTSGADASTLWNNPITFEGIKTEI